MRKARGYPTDQFTAQIAEQAELDARAKLAEIKATALDAFEKLVLNAKLEACATAIVTTGISQKSTRLSNEMATQDVADALIQIFEGVH